MGAAPAPDPVEQNFLWTGYEDYTGLWQAEIEAPARARGLIESFLARGWVELYVSRGAAGHDTMEIVDPAQRRQYLANDAYWAVPDGPGTTLVWFATTDRGYEAYERLRSAG